MKMNFSYAVFPALVGLIVAHVSVVYADNLEDKLRKTVGEVAKELEGGGSNEEKLERLGSKIKGVVSDLEKSKDGEKRVDVLEGMKMSGPKVDVSKLTDEVLSYKDGDEQMEGFAVYKTQSEAKLPVVLIVHQWMGITDYEKARARQLAEMGYLAICIDVYGKGVRPANPQEAGALAGKYKGDRGQYRRRLLTGLAQVFAHPKADGSKVVAIGYCFGGTGVLELARTGAEVKGVVSFHGGLDSLTPDDGALIGCKVLVCHGADDPLQKEADLAAFEKEMRDHKVDWQLIKYGGAVHSFTQPMAGNDKSKGAAYDKKADVRSWKDMNQFFSEVLK